MAIVEVIKYNGTPDVYAWKYPNEELGTWTQLIVNEAQEAVLYKGGKALDVFQSGCHTLETANIPLLNQIVNLPFGGRSPFAAEVWYINKAYSLDIKWGTTSPIQIQDPKYAVFVPLRAFGQFGIQIENAKQFLTRLVGTLPVFDKTALVKYFRGLYLTKAKDAISSYLIHRKISVMEMNAYLDELSDYLQQRLAPALEEYGIRLVNFYVNDVSVPEDDPAVIQLKTALAKRAEMNIIGYNYQQERSFDTLEGAAKNNGGTAGALMGAGVGLGVGVAAGGVIGQGIGGIAGALDCQAPGQFPCPSCAKMMKQGDRFCSACGFHLKQGETKGADGMVTCSKCGAAYKNTVKFCPECGEKYRPCPACGADLAEDATVCTRCQYQFSKPCPHCGAMLEAGGKKFCPECGQQLS